MNGKQDVMLYMYTMQWPHIYEVSKVVKLVETEKRVVPTQS
jgi:hypothetical protein